MLIRGADGQTVAALDTDTVGRHLVIDNIPLELSFGRDATGELTVTLSGADTNAFPLHFSACGKNIDADKATVTLSFAPDLKSVAVDPGYLGTVQVDSHLLRARSLADDVLTPSESITTLGSSAPEMATSAFAPATDTTVTVPALPSPVIPAPSEPVAPAPASPVAVATTASPASAPTPAPGSTSLASAAAALENPSITTLASQIKPLLPPMASPAPAAAPAAPSYVPAVVTTSPDGTKRVKLYWAEPVTGPDGSAPSIAADEIKLVEVHGSVLVIAPDGSMQSGTEGMAVASGSTVRTGPNSSVALFMGGVNSARLMPNCELVVTQALDGSVRTNVVDLRAGAVFSRVGHRDGETENFTVVTPEGSTQAATTDMLAYRGTPDDLRTGPSTSLALPLDTRNLLAWDPAPTRGLLSDVPAMDLGVTKDQDNKDQGNKDQGSNDKNGKGQDNNSQGNKDQSNKDQGSNDKNGKGQDNNSQGNKDQGNKGQSGKNTYFYYADCKSQVDSNDIRHEVFCQGGNDSGKDNEGGKDNGKGGDKNGGKNNFGNGGGNGWGNGGDHGRGGNNNGRGNGGGDCQSQYVLQQILTTLQPYNCKLKAVLTDVDDGKATSAELKFYHELTSVFFCEQEPQIVNQYLHDPRKFDQEICVYDKVLNQDLCEFGLPALTPGARTCPL